MFANEQTSATTAVNSASDGCLRYLSLIHKVARNKGIVYRIQVANLKEIHLRSIREICFTVRKSSLLILIIEVE